MSLFKIILKGYQGFTLSTSYKIHFALAANAAEAIRKVDEYMKDKPGTAHDKQIEECRIAADIDGSITQTPLHL